MVEGGAVCECLVTDLTCSHNTYFRYALATVEGKVGNGVSAFAYGDLLQGAWNSALGTRVTVCSEEITQIAVGGSVFHSADKGQGKTLEPGSLNNAEAYLLQGVGESERGQRRAAECGCITYECCSGS